MEILLLALPILVGIAFLRSREQQRRIALLARHLGQYRIEKLMENLSQGYLRALGEDDPQRSEPIWGMLATAEQEIARQFQRFADDFARIDGSLTRVSRLPVALPFAERVFPGTSFDLRQVFAVHAQGIASAAANPRNLAPRDKAFIMTAELMLMQHSCHWFCRSRTTASARLLLRHQTPYEQVLGAVAPATRASYLETIGA